MRAVSAQHPRLVAITSILLLIRVRRRARSASSSQLLFDTDGTESVVDLVVYRLSVFMLRSPLLAGIAWLGGVQFTYSTSQYRTHEIVFLMDVSYSMSAQDVGGSRSELMNSVLTELVGSIAQLTDSDYITAGVVYFAGRPLAISPVTDLNVAQRYLGAYPSSITQQGGTSAGTALGEAMILAKSMFTPSAKQKSVLIVSDGGVNSGVQPVEVAQVLDSEGVHVDSVAVGSSVGGSVTVPTTFGDIQQVVGGVDRKRLKQIAESGGGVGYTLATQDSVDIFTASYVRESLDQNRYYTQHTVPVWFGVLLVTVISAISVLVYNRLLGMGSVRSLVGMMVVLCLISVSGWLIRTPLGSEATVSISSADADSKISALSQHVEDGGRVVYSDRISKRCIGPAYYSQVLEPMIEYISSIGYPCEVTPDSTYVGEIRRGFIGGKRILWYILLMTGGVVRCFMMYKYPNHD